MINGKDTIIRLIVGLIKKWVKTFLNRLEVLEEIFKLKLIFQTMQQKLI